jgi:hypothetical protein
MEMYAVAAATCPHGAVLGGSAAMERSGGSVMLIQRQNSIFHAARVTEQASQLYLVSVVARFVARNEVNETVLVELPEPCEVHGWTPWAP